MRKALKALEQAVQSSPWLLSDNFVSSMVDKKGHMALVGPGDPTGKGRGFSFTKDPRRVSLRVPFKQQSLRVQNKGSRDMLTRV